MDEHKNDEPVATEKPAANEIPEREQIDAAADEPAVTGEERAHAEQDSPNGRRGRMVMAGLVAAVVLSLVAVLVAGIFGVTARWRMICPAELPVNDPAKALWSNMVTDKPVPASLGVTGQQADQARLRGSN